MKYFKNYKTYKTYESDIKRDFDVGILDILSPIFSFADKIKSKKRLRKISNSYDNYLMLVYKQYITTKVFGLETNDLDKIKIDSLSNDIFVEPIQKENNKVRSKIDSGKIKGAIKDDSNVNNKESNKEVIDTIPEIEPIQKETIEDKYKIKKDDLIQKAKKFNQGSIIGKFKYNGEPFDIKELGIKTDGNLSGDDKKEVENIITDYIKIKLNTDIEYAIKETEKELEDSNKKISYHTSKKSHFSNLRTNTSGDVRDKYQTEIDSHTKELEKAYKLRDNAKNGISELRDELQPITESNDWKATDIYHSDWSDKDRKELTKMVNPYKIIQFETDANILIENSKSNKLKNIWESLKNSVHQRWAYTFDIPSLKTELKVADKKEKEKTPIAKKAIETNSKISLILKEKYGSNIRSYNSPYYTNLVNESSFYYFLNINGKIFLLEKKEFIGKRLVFAMMCEVKATKSGELELGKFFNTNSNKLNIDIIKSHIFYKEFGLFPFIIIKENVIYSYYDDNIEKVSQSPINLISMNYKVDKEILPNGEIDQEDLESGVISSEDAEFIKNYKM